MSMFSFDVGKKEVHTVTFELNRLTWGHKISVNGKIIKKGSQFTIGSGEAAFDVGKKEKHNIRIYWRIPSFGAFRAIETQVYIDGIPYNTYKL